MLKAIAAFIFISAASIAFANTPLDIYLSGNAYLNGDYAFIFPELQSTARTKENFAELTREALIYKALNSNEVEISKDLFQKSALGLTAQKRIIRHFLGSDEYVYKVFSSMLNRSQATEIAKLLLKVVPEDRVKGVKNAPYLFSTKTIDLESLVLGSADGNSNSYGLQACYSSDLQVGFFTLFQSSTQKVEEEKKNCNDLFRSTRDYVHTVVLNSPEFALNFSYLNSWQNGADLVPDSNVFGTFTVNGVTKYLAGTSKVEGMYKVQVKNGPAIQFVANSFFTTDCEEISIRNSTAYEAAYLVYRKYIKDEKTEACNYDDPEVKDVYLPGGVMTIRPYQSKDTSSL